MAYLLCVRPDGLLGIAEIAHSDSGLNEVGGLPGELVDAIRESCFAGMTWLASTKATVEPLPPTCVFWRNFSRRYFSSVCREYAPSHKKWRAPNAPDDESLNELLQSAPPMRGLEYASADTIRSLWQGLDEYTRQRVATHGSNLADYLRILDPAWNLVGRVTFHLAENKKNPNTPFAFLATYTEGQTQTGSPQHIPLSEALKKSIDQRDSAKLEELLEPVSRASQKCPLVERLLDSRRLFAPQAWGIRDAFEFLSSVPAMEDAGVIVRVPNWWNASKPPRPQVSVRIGSTGPRKLTLADSLDFNVELSIDGQPLTEGELTQLMAAREGLSLLRGKWVQVDHDKLQSALKHWKTLQRQHVGGLDFLQGMRLLSGATIGEADVDDEVQSWTRIEPGEWMRELLHQLREPDSKIPFNPEDGLNAKLRHYQIEGVHWLWFATQLGLGVCLADDMGLGKTIQVLSLLLQLKKQSQTSASKSPQCKPSLLIVPTSLLGNWQREVSKFAPQIKLFVAHRSVADASSLKRIAEDVERELADFDLVVTTYGLARTATWLTKSTWGLVILDEAQAIKNSGATQSKAIKMIQGRGRILLTGTPVENHLGDLWSLFDFCSPGLLGTAAQFKKFINPSDEQQRSRRLTSVRKLIRPYVLRRLKTDPDVAPDLPAKTEMRVDCGLTATQAALYERILVELKNSLDIATGIQRRGMVLSVLMQLKQICNHPSLYLKQNSFPPESSGKFSELESICEVLIERQEKLLVFTQFQSMCDPLDQFLASVFNRSGLVLTGKTPAAKRSLFVSQFQEVMGPPYFVISVKAGGTGLNLTEASHVVHFDRWWNPAVEDQATDRAFRIGQKRNVLVHKFVCRGTLEERIDELIQSKKLLSQQLFGKDGELNLTEMTNEQLMEFVSLDLNKASGG